MTARIHRGLHRVGLVLAVPPLMVAGWIACSEAWQAWATSGLPPERFIASDGSVTFEEAFGTHHAYYGHALAWAALALVLYAAARAVGRVLAGFFGEDRGTEP